MIEKLTQALHAAQGDPQLGPAAMQALRLLDGAPVDWTWSTPEGGQPPAEVVAQYSPIFAREEAAGWAATVARLETCTSHVVISNVKNKQGLVLVFTEVPSGAIVGIVVHDLALASSPEVIAAKEKRARAVADAELERLNALGDGSLTIASATPLHFGAWQFLTSRPWAEIGSEMVLSGFLAGVWDDGVIYLAAHDATGDVMRTKPLFSADDVRAVVPLSKGDFFRANKLVDFGYPAVEPILGELLIWVQDGNWPIAGVMANFLAGIGAPLAPHIRAVLDGDDDIWKSAVINIAGENAALFDIFKDDLRRIATAPTEGERREGTDEVARDVLEAGPQPRTVDPRISIRQTFACWRRKS